MPAASNMCLGLTVGQLSSPLWDMVRRISDKYIPSTVSHLKANNNAISDVREICNTLAERFAFNASSDNYSDRL